MKPRFSFTDIFIKRPVLSIVLSLVILLVGVRAYFGLQTRLFPKMDSPVVEIVVPYAGADAELVESTITTPIENALGGVDGINYIESHSLQGRSWIIIYFKIGYDINQAMSDVNAKVAGIRSSLPQEINDPIIDKNDPNSYPTLWLTFSSDTMSLQDITDYLNRVVQPQLQTANGVAVAPVWGKYYAMRVWLNPALMAARGISASDIKNALTSQNLQVPAGQIETSSQVLNVKTVTELSSSEQFEHLVIKESNGTLTRIRDIGRTEFGITPDSERMSVSAGGKPTVIIPITPAPNANPIDVSITAKKLIAEIVPNMPKAISYRLMWDNSKFIVESIKEVKLTIVAATVCVIFVIFLFLGSGRLLLIPAVVIPLSLVGVFGIMMALGYSLNIITFLALVLAIGMVVDDAIVVSENIYRHMVLGQPPLNAALLGAREIQFAVISMTFTLAAVYAPIGFLSGFVGAFFKEFAFTLASAVIVSGFIALTLSPMMCSRIMTKSSSETKFAAKIDNLSNWMMNKYSKWLSFALSHRVKIIILIPVLLCGSYILYKFIPSELAPKEDLGVIMVVGDGPTAANLSYTEKYGKMLEPIFNQVAEKDNYLIVSGDSGKANELFSFLALKPWSERKRSSDQIVEELTPKIQAITGMQLFPFIENSIPIPGSEMPISMIIQTTGSYAELNAVTKELVTTASANPKLVGVKSNLNIDQPQLNISIDRNKAGDLGIPIRNIGEAINLGIGKPTVSHFSIFGRRYDVVPELDTQFRDRPEIINQLYLNTPNNLLVSLANLVSISEVVAPQGLNHFQQMRSATITADTASGYSLGEALSFLQTAAKKVIKPGMQISYSGLSRQYFQTGSQMMTTFIFALIFIFLVLAAQFESFRDPLIVLFSVPLSIFGALLAMRLTGCTMNIYSEIGLITLVGLISKHGILMVEFANQLQAEGKEIKDAIVAAASIRLRPILMTTAAMVLGALPLAFAHGAGAAARQQIGWTVIGGMLIGTVFTLFIVPTMYTYLATSKRVLA